MTIKLKLIIMSVVSCSLVVINSLYSLSSLRHADESLEHLYKVDMKVSTEISEILIRMNEIEAHLLLALQHDKNAANASLHNHSVQKHFKVIDDNLTLIRGQVQLLKNADVEPGAKSDIKAFARVLTKFEEETLAIKQLILANDYARANAKILEVVYGSLEAADRQGHELLSYQEEDVKKGYEQSVEEYEKTVFTSFVLLFLVVGVTGFVSAAIILNISRTVHSMRSTAEKLADGYLNERIQHKGGDELSEISAAFNSVAESFRATVDMMQSAILQISSASEETAQISTGTASDVESQRSETELVATAVNEMGAAVREVAQNTASAADAALAASESANLAKSVIGNAADAINELANSAANTGVAIKDLQQESDKIGSVLDVIRDIAEQTNLLALNAAIEAARAGEQGRGFAVVADEVRTLASRTQQSTQEINDMISRLQESADKAVNTVEEGQAHAKLGVEEVDKAKETLEAINGAVHSIRDMNSQIACAVEEQSSVTEDIGQRVHQISDFAGQTLIGTQQSAAASEELAHLATGLQENISVYRI